MKHERWIWFAGGAIAGLAGASGAAVLVWALFFHESPVVLAMALVLMLVLAQFVHRSRSQVAARIWSATSWLGLSGVCFWAAVTYLGDRLPLAPPSQAQLVAFATIWAGFTGMLAVGLFALGRWLSGHATERARRPQSQ